MPIFKYKASDSEKNLVAGLVEAPTESLAAEILRDNNLEVIYLGPDKGKKINLNISLFNRIKTKDLVIFSRQFSVMVSANVAIVQALGIVAEQTENEKLKSVITEISDEVDGGARLSEAMSKKSKVFSEFFVSVIKSGETSGKLDEVLNYLADEMEKDFDMMSKIKGAMIYPIFLFCTLVVVGALMMIKVIPQLTAVMIESGAPLPMATKILIGISDFLVSYWWLFLIILVAAVVGFRFYAKTISGKRTIDHLKLKLPLFGNLLKNIYLVRFSRSMHTLILGGVTISKSLEVAADVVDNEIYKELIIETLKEVENGNTISGVFAASPEVPKMVSQMLSVGEKTGKLDLVLAKVTDFYTRDINNTVNNLMSLMEPVIMVIMGIAVAVMVAAIILPMYNMASAF
ncbi:MAG: type II secretion system F family protein [Patescibacteria group bacterium]|nr:type II secretion system F family protein [Patescibacteria group bacterium]